jgi:hypothetical protein
MRLWSGVDYNIVICELFEHDNYVCMYKGWAIKIQSLHRDLQ